MLYPGQNHLAADKVNGDYFYIWDRGSFYVSTNGGKSFHKTDCHWPYCKRRQQYQYWLFLCHCLQHRSNAGKNRGCVDRIL